MSDNLVFLSWDHVMDRVQQLATSISRDHNDIEELISIARGGMVVGCLLSYALPLRSVQIISSVRYSKIEETIDHDFSLPKNINAKRKALLVDDLIDRGVTIDNIKKELIKENPGLEIITCTISIKDSADIHPLHYPDYYIDTYDYSEWLVYPWETMEKESRER